MKYQERNHSKFLINYHVILVVKYRKSLLLEYGGEVKEYMIAISQRSNFRITEMEVYKDHIHIMIESDPKVSPLQIVRVLKQESTVSLWKTYYDDLKNHFWKEKTFWSDGYFCCSIGNCSIESVKQYIESQG